MLTTLLLTSGLAALAAADDSAQGKGFVKYAVTAQKQSWAGPTRRQSNVDLKNIELGLAYTIELGFGTPAQPVPVQLDTGSVDLWVNPNCAHERNEQAIAFCQTFPRFDWRESSTLVDKNETWPQGYGIGNVTFEWVTDNVAVGGATVKNQQFGVTIDSYSLSLGILGVGPVYTTNPDSHPQYSFFIDSLATQGITASRAFSLDLRSVDSPDGSIIFGGVDTGKYEGALEKLPIIPGKNAPGGADRYWVTLESIDVVPSGEASTNALSTPVPVVLDSGSTLSTFPQDVFETIGAAIPGAAFDSASGFYIVDCAIGDTTGTVDFVFGKKTIKVAFKDFIWEIDTNVCVVGAQGFAPGGEFSFTILGDSFLRAAYAVFDQDNQNIHIAQAINCGTNLVAIGTGPDAVPSITGGCGGTSSTTSASSTSTEPPASSTTEPPASSTTEPPSSSATETSTKSGPHGNATSTYSHRSGRPSHSPTLTSTVTKTSVYTVTSCPPTVTNCPVGHVTTEIITSLTTWCPEAETTTHRGPGIPCLRCTGGFPGETTITTTVKPTPCHKCGETGGETPVPTSTVKPCPTCSGAPTHSTTSGHAVVTAGVGRLMGNAGLAVVVAAALL